MGSDNSLCHFRPGDPLFHRSAADMPVSFVLGHMFAFDEDPFCLVDQAEFLHFVLNGDLLLYNGAEPLPYRAEKPDAVGEHSGAYRLGEHRHAARQRFIIHFLVYLARYHQQHAGFAAGAQIDAELHSVPVGERRVDNDDITGFFQHEPLCSADAAHRRNRPKIRRGKQRSDGRIHFFGG